MGEVVRAFAAAHEIDPQVPRIHPKATRRLLGKHRRRGKPAGTPTGTTGGGATAGAPTKTG